MTAQDQLMSNAYSLRRVYARARFRFPVRCLGGVAGPLVLSPEILEPARRQLSIAHGVLDIPVPEVGLERPRVVALVGQRKATGVAQHVGMCRKA